MNGGRIGSKTVIVVLALLYLGSAILLAETPVSHAYTRGSTFVRVH